MKVNRTRTALMNTPLLRLYSFRRCPYAMRARLGLLFAELKVELREIELKNKPAPMLAISPKGTVPVLELLAQNGSQQRVIEESREILEWALQQNDPHGLLNNTPSQANALLEQNDKEFKYWLDRYKYADRFPELTQIEYRERGEVFLQTLENLLMQHKYLLGNKISSSDLGIMPFVRQFAHVNKDAFYALPYPKLQQWLATWLEHPLFQQAMVKFKPWQEGDAMVVFP